jgi:hypothetical protein
MDAGPPVGGGVRPYQGGGPPLRGDSGVSQAMPEWEQAQQWGYAYRTTDRQRESLCRDSPPDMIRSREPPMVGRF